MKRLPFLFTLLFGYYFTLSAQSAGQGFTFDMGTEPEPTSCVSYGMIQYSWTDTVSSRIDIRYTTGMNDEETIEGYDTAIYNAKQRVFEADILPYVRYFSMDESGREFCWSIGFSLQHSKENEFVGLFDVNGLMLDPGDEGKYFTMNDEKTAFFIAPRLGVSAKIPLTLSFRLNAECFVHPFYYMSLKQNMSYHSDQTTTPFDYSGDNSVSRVSSPYISLKLSLDIFSNFRLITLCSYQHLDFQQMDWAGDFNSLIGYDDKQDMFTFRFGLELLSGNEKSARLRGGVYYQVDVNKSSYLNTTASNSRWILNLGTEL